MAILIQYHYCNLDPEKRGCVPGSRQECRDCKEGIGCQHFKHRKEGEDVDCN